MESTGSWLNFSIGTQVIARKIIVTANPSSVEAVIKNLLFDGLYEGNTDKLSHYVDPPQLGWVKKANCRCSPCRPGWMAYAALAKAKASRARISCVTINHFDNNAAFIEERAVHCRRVPQPGGDRSDGWKIMKSYRYDLRRN